MRITKIRISSLYGIHHLELDGKPIEMRGKRGTGKTSVIDSIRYALTNQSERDYVVKQGEREGEIFIETDTGLAINRKKRTDAGDYNKITEFGKPIKSPQSFVNEVFTPLQLNPIEFASWPKDEQNRAILSLIEFEWDMNWIKKQFGEVPRGINYDQHILQVLEAIQAKGSDYWERREDANRKELYKRQSAEEIARTIPAGYDLGKWESYSLSEKITQLQTIQKSNSEIDRATAFIEAYNNKLRGYEAERDIEISSEEQAIASEREGLKATLERLKAEIIATEDKLSSLQGKLEDKKQLANARYNEKVAKLDGDIQIAKKYEGKEKEPTEKLQAEIQEAEQMKKFISEYKSLQKMRDECKELKEESQRLDAKIKLARRLPGIVLETAKIPIPGLTVKDGKPLINGLPISNLSNGERIELCVDVTIAKPNKLQIILLDGVEALDDESRNSLYAKCREKGLQVIAAKTSNDNEFTIVELDSGEVTKFKEVA